MKKKRKRTERKREEDKFPVQGSASIFLSQSNDVWRFTNTRKSERGRRGNREEENSEMRRDQKKSPEARDVERKSGRKKSERNVWTEGRTVHISCLLMHSVICILSLSLSFTLDQNGETSSRPHSFVHESGVEFKDRILVFRVCLMVSREEELVLKN